MAKSNNVTKLKGLTPERKKHYVFAFSPEDFASFTGIMPYEIKEGKGCITDKYVYIYCNYPEQIRGLQKIEASLTNEFKSFSSPKMVESVKAEIQICNFVSNSYFNPEHIPNVLKEVMAEIGSRSPEEYLSFPCIGMVVKSKRAYAPIGVAKGAFGIIVSLYGPQLDEVQILFQNGSSTGFSKEETIEDLEFFSLTENQEIRNYKYKDLVQLYDHFEDGFFDSEFGDKY